MTSIIDKRLSLHKALVEQQEHNDTLKSQLIHLQSLANIGTASFMIAHEINNLLTPLANYAALALKNSKDSSMTEKAYRKDRTGLPASYQSYGKHVGHGKRTKPGERKYKVDNFG